jgi:hypothetical protein
MAGVHGCCPRPGSAGDNNETQCLNRGTSRKDHLRLSFGVKQRRTIVGDLVGIVGVLRNAEDGLPGEQGGKHKPAIRI